MSVVLYKAWGQKQGSRKQKDPRGGFSSCLIAGKEDPVCGCCTSLGVRSRNMPVAVCLCLVAGINLSVLLWCNLMRSEA